VGVLSSPHLKLGQVSPKNLRGGGSEMGDEESTIVIIDEDDDEECSS
jgi:hypothetical protein